MRGNLFEGEGRIISIQPAFAHPKGESQDSTLSVRIARRVRVNLFTPEVLRSQEITYL